MPTLRFMGNPTECRGRSAGEGVVRSFENGSLRETDVIARRGERMITAAELWAEVDRRLPPPAAQ